MGHNLSPRGDGNYFRSSIADKAITTQLIPARGRKPFDGNGLINMTNTTQLIPARGRKPHRARKHDNHLGHNLSPRGDGNLTGTPNPRSLMDTTYPREGTETYFCFALLSLLSNLTQLIPARGRKRFDLLFFRHLYPTQLIPARGRKRLRRIGRSSRVPDTTYPREGTETPTPPQSRQSGRTQLIPARGRKRCGASGGQAVCRDTTYPREGTET